MIVPSSVGIVAEQKSGVLRIKNGTTKMPRGIWMLWRWPVTDAARKASGRNLVRKSDLLLHVGFVADGVSNPAISVPSVHTLARSIE